MTLRIMVFCTVLMLVVAVSGAFASTLGTTTSFAKALGVCLPGSGELGGLNLIWDPQPPLPPPPPVNPPPPPPPPPPGMGAPGQMVSLNLIWDPQPPLPPPPPGNPPPPPPPPGP